MQEKDLLKTFLESYWIATKSMGQKKSKQKKKGDVEKHMNYLGKRFYTLGVVEHIGALSTSNFKNAIKVINEDIINSVKSSEDKSERFEELNILGQRIYDFCDFKP